MCAPPPWHALAGSGGHHQWRQPVRAGPPAGCTTSFGRRPAAARAAAARRAPHCCSSCTAAASLAVGHLHCTFILPCPHPPFKPFSRCFNLMERGCQ